MFCGHGAPRGGTSSGKPSHEIKRVGTLHGGSTTLEWPSDTFEVDPTCMEGRRIFLGMHLVRTTTLHLVIIAFRSSVNSLA